MSLPPTANFYARPSESDPPVDRKYWMRLYTGVLVLDAAFIRSRTPRWALTSAGQLRAPGVQRGSTKELKISLRSWSGPMTMLALPAKCYLKQCFRKPFEAFQSVLTLCIIWLSRLATLTLVLVMQVFCGLLSYLFRHGLKLSFRYSVIASTFRELQRLGAFLFFDRFSTERSDPSIVIRTLAFQLCANHPQVCNLICAADDPGGTPSSVKETRCLSIDRDTSERSRY